MPQVTPAHTAAEVARLLRVKREKVCHWIATGELVAYSVSDGKRPRWRICPDALADFLRSRTRHVAPPPPRPRAKLPPHVKEFIPRT